MPSISLPPPKCILCMKPITKRPFAYWGRHWAAVAHPKCVERKLHIDGPELPPLCQWCGQPLRKDAPCPCTQTDGGGAEA